MVNLLNSLRFFYLLSTLTAAFPLTPRDDLGHWINERRDEINVREDLINSTPAPTNQLAPRDDLSNYDWRGFLNTANAGVGLGPVNTNGNGWIHGGYGESTGVNPNGVANGQAGSANSNNNGNANPGGGGAQANGVQANGALANGAQDNGGFDNLGTVPVNGANGSGSSFSADGSNQAVSGGSNASNPSSVNGQAGGSTDESSQGSNSVNGGGGGGGSTTSGGTSDTASSGEQGGYQGGGADGGL